MSHEGMSERPIRTYSMHATAGRRIARPFACGSRRTRPPARRRGRPGATTAAALGALLASMGAGAAVLTVTPPELPVGATWTMLEIEGTALPEVPSGFASRTFWDLRPQAEGRAVTWTVQDPAGVGLAAEAAEVGADRALCADTGERGCRLFRSTEVRAYGVRVLWSGAAGEPRAARGDRAATRTDGSAGVGALAGAVAPTKAREHSMPAEGRRLVVGARYRDAPETREGTAWLLRGRVVGEGVALVPAGPREVLVLREEIRAGDATTLRYRFVTARGETAASLSGPAPRPGATFRPERGEVLLSSGIDAVDDGIQIAYSDLSGSLAPGTIGFLQYSVVNQCSVSRTFCSTDLDCPAGEVCGTPLTALDPAWIDVNTMITVDQPSATYQPDPGDPASTQNLGEIWDFSGITAGNLTYRTFNTTRDDLLGPSCPQDCALRDQSASPPDGTWQSYLKIDVFDPVGVQFTRDVFTLNDNDTGANPAIDLPYVSFDEMNTDDWTQICGQDSGGGTERLIHFFRFFGATPATAVMKRGDTWRSGNWTECDGTRGLHLTLASECGAVCYPGCPLGTAPFARGMLGAGAGFESTVIEDGWVKVPAGNYVPALLMRQVRDIEAGLDFLFTVCSLGTTRSYSIDYFWLHRRYGLLANVSSPTDDTATMPPDDWSLKGNVTDGADFTWGPFPPYQTEALACLSGTRVRWSLPADGSNLNGAPAVSDYGYVVSWGNQTDPEALADWTTNPDHSPLPGEAGYLAAPAGAEPTSYVIGGWAGAAINVTVTTALRYTDPDVADTQSYRSPAFYKVVEDPARLDPATFRVGDGVAPFVVPNGNDLDLSWPAVAGAESYLVKVWDLGTGTEIPCPAGMNCTPALPMTTHPGGAADASGYGYRAFAVDPCAEVSAN